MMYSNVKNPSSSSSSSIIDRTDTESLSECLLGQQQQHHDDNDKVRNVVGGVEGRRHSHFIPTSMNDNNVQLAGEFGTIHDETDDPNLMNMLMMNTTTSSTNNNDSNNDNSPEGRTGGTRGIPFPTTEQPQQPVHRDVSFAIAFVLQILVVVGIAITWGWSALQHGNDITTTTNSTTTGNDNTSEDDTSSVSISAFVWLCMVPCWISIGLSGTFLQYMTNYAEQFIQSSLIVSCGTMGLCAVILFLNGSFWLGIVWSIIVAITLLYTRRVWDRIPFASATLQTALSAIQTNAGICVLAYAVSVLANLYVLVWSLAFMGVQYRELNCQNGICIPHRNVLSILALVFSYYWTTQVLKNVLHVTVSGVVGTWWFAPHDALSIFSPAILDSLGRATSYSFGSICMGR
jgi:hypothetical protein